MPGFSSNRLGNVLNHANVVHELQELMPKGIFRGRLSIPVNLRGIKISLYQKFALQFCNHTEKQK